MCIYRSKLILLPKLSIRGTQRQCTRRKEQVCGSGSFVFLILEHCRCARNCFMCPNCRNTLSVVASDPPNTGDGRTPLSFNEPPFFLYCNHCRWDSAEIGITFEKPTGLAGASLLIQFQVFKGFLPNTRLYTAQLQKFEDTAPDSLEFDRLKEHFEPFIRASSLSSSTLTGHAPAHHPSSAAHSHHLHSASITAAASAALARDIPGVSKYNPLARSTSGKAGSGKDRSINKDEMAEYRSRFEILKADAVNMGGGDADTETLRRLKDINQISTMEQRWANSWVTPLQTQYVHRLLHLSNLIYRLK